MSQDKPISCYSRLELFVGVALVLLTLLVYSPTFQHPFVNYDDGEYVSQNGQVQAGLTADSVRWAFTTFHCGNWHPLTWLSLQLDFELYGGQGAGGFHLTNVLLHTANTLLLFLVLSRLTGRVWRSAVVAALFALHPLHVESVAWVSERKDVLSTLFWMLTLAAYLDYVRRPGVRRYLLVVLALGFGLLAKQMLVTLPCLVLLLDYWPLRRWRRGPEPAPAGALPQAASGRQLLLEKVPLFALVLIACVVVFLAQLHGEAVAPFEAFPLAARIGNALLAYTSYIGMMFWPMHLAVHYAHPGPAVSMAKALGAGLLLVILTLLVLGPGRRWPYLAVGWLWYLGTLVPVIGLVQVGMQAMADRYTYVPLIGLFLLLTWGVSDLATAWRLPRHYLVATTAVVLSACVVLTWLQVRHWSSTLRLWEHAAAITENNALAHTNLGTCYYERGMLSDAKREFEKAVTIIPGFTWPHFNLGNVLADLGRREQAVAEFRKAVALDPETAWPHNNLGNMLRDLGRLEEAQAEYDRAIALDPEYALAHNNLGIVLAELGRGEEAVAEFRQAIALDAANAWPHKNLGNALRDLGRLEEACAEYRRASALDPKDALLHNNLGRALQEEGRLDEASAEYHKALDRGDKQAWSRLQTCERLRRLRLRLPGLIAGRDRPADNAERLAFADLCRQPGERRYALAARLYTDAFNGDPRMADDLWSANRLNAAGAAAAGGCGQGQDAAELNEEEKARLRHQALKWLQADLAGRSKQAQSDLPNARAEVQAVLRLWQRNAGLAGVRVPASLMRLPEAERAAWQKLWQEVEAVLAKASTPRKKS